MKTVAFYLAWRYLVYKHDNASITAMIRICFAGIAIGTCALMLSLIVTNGFDREISEKIRGINSPLIISSPGNRLDEASIEAALKPFKDRVVGISGSSFKQIIIDQEDSQTVAIVRGINPVREASVSTIAHKVVSPMAPKTSAIVEHFVKLLAPGRVLLGHKLARQLRLKRGDPITVLVPQPRSKKSVKLATRTLEYAGCFNVGLEEYDSKMMLMNHETMDELFDEEGVDQIALALTQHDDAFVQETADILSKRFNHLSVTTWQEQYPALVSSLKLEKYVMFLVLALISLVACMNMISLLFMQIQHKMRDIALFSTLGMSSSTLQQIFMIMSVVITCGGSLTGLGIAAVIGYIIQFHTRIPLPDVYFISYLPARMEMDHFIIVFITTLLLGLLATYFPIRRIRKLNIVSLLRNA